MSQYTERVGSELSTGISLSAVLEENGIGASFAAQSAAHGSVVVELFDPRTSRELGARFIEGARRAAALDHPAALPVLADGVTSQGEAFVVHPRFEGERARDLVKRRPARVPPVEALRLVGDLLDVLTAAHGAGLIHGGLTTSELFIADDGSVRVFGLGWDEIRRRIAERDGRLPLAVGFAAPERIVDRARPADESADVWSAGAILFSLLTGEVPYEGTNDGEQQASARERPPRSLTELYGETPIVLARLVDTALDPDPQRRFGTARMRSLAREIAQLPELFLLRDLRSNQTPSPISGPRRSPSAHARAPGVPKADIAIAFRTAETLPAQAAPVARRAAADTIPALPSVETQPPSAQRRRVADVLVGEATCSESDVRLLGELFQRLEAALVAPSGSAVALDALASHARDALAASSGGFVWNVAPWGFFAGQHALWEPAEACAHVAYRLYRDGVRSFGLLPGAPRHELARFVEILALPVPLGSSEDDSVTLLHEAGFEHLVFRAIEPRGALSGSRRHDANRERQETFALASFDTTTQLEDCWYESHKGITPERAEPVLAAPREHDENALLEFAARFESEAKPEWKRVLNACVSGLSVPFAQRAVESHLRAAREALAENTPAERLKEGAS